MNRSGLSATLRTVAAALASFAITTTTACKKDEGGAGGGGGDESLPFAAVKEAKELFAQRCTTCHGASGKGDGPGAVALNPKPRAFGDAAWQKSVTDAHIEKIILAGGQAVGKSVAMPPNPDLERKPMVVKALRQHIRSFK